MDPVLKIKLENGTIIVFLSKMLCCFDYNENTKTVTVKGEVSGRWYQETFENCMGCVYE